MTPVLSSLRLVGTLGDAFRLLKETNLRTHKRLYGPAMALAVAATLVGLPTPSAGQGIGFTAYSGFRLGGNLSIEGGDLRVDEAPFLGAQFDFRVRRDATVAVIVDYQPTTLLLDEFGEPTEELFDLNVFYLHVGGTYEVIGRSLSGPRPFVLGTLGVSMFDPGSGSESNDSEYGFSGIFGGGIKVPLGSGRMGLKLQLRVLLNNMLNGDGSLWCGPGGCWAGSVGPIGPIQFDFGGGLFFGGG